MAETVVLPLRWKLQRHSAYPCPAILKYSESIARASPKQLSPNLGSGLKLSCWDGLVVRHISVQISEVNICLWK